MAVVLLGMRNPCQIAHARFGVEFGEHGVGALTLKLLGNCGLWILDVSKCDAVRTTC